MSGWSVGVDEFQFCFGFVLGGRGGCWGNVKILLLFLGLMGCPALVGLLPLDEKKKKD